MRKGFVLRGVSFLVVAVAFMVGSGVAFARVSGAFDVPFAFVVGDKELPAGQYTVQTKGPDDTLVMLQSVTNGESMMVPVVTRLADMGGKVVRVIFDKTESGKSYLSEIHIPGLDGFAIKGAPGTHTHVKVSGKE